MKYIVVCNPAKWYKCSWQEEVIENKNLFWTDDIVPFTGMGWARKLCQKHYSPKINKKFSFPGKRIWYNNIINGLHIQKDNDEYVMVIYDWHCLSRDFSFLRFLRKRVPNIHIIYFLSNIAQKSGAYSYGILDKLKENYDMVFTFDKADAQKYGFEYFPLIYTGMKLDSGKDISTDLFFVGKAKDRLNQLIAVFEQAKAENLRCDFYITGVEEELQVYSNEIHYNQEISYYDVIKHIKSTKCVLEVIQGESTGFTLRVCESVIYNKKLITTNKEVRTASFFDKSRIMFWPVGGGSLNAFVNSPMAPYTEEDKYIFSPKRLFCVIEQKLGCR